MSFTVTAAEAGGVGHNGIAVKVLVLTGATETGGASASVNSSSPAQATVSITPTFSTSLIVWAVSGFVNSSNTYSAFSNNSQYDQGYDSTNTFTYAHGHFSATVTGGTPVTIGATSSVIQTGQEICGYEIPTSGASTPALDASTPAVATASGAMSVTTAAFSPPSTCVLAALIASRGTGSQVTSYTLTDTSGLGLTWNQQIFFASNSACAVYTATVTPPPPPPPPPTTLYQMRSFS